MTALKWPKTDTKIKVVIFDMDDTLYLERDFVLSGFRAVARWGETTLNIPYTKGYALLKQYFVENIRGNTFNLWLNHFQQTNEALVPRLIEVYREHTPDITPLPEMADAVHHLSQYTKLALLSDGYLAVQQRKFHALRLADYFDCVVFSDQFGRENWKPSTIPYQHILDHFDIPGQNAIYIGDNASKDFYGAHQLGLQTIHLRHLQGLYGEKQPPTDQHRATVSTADVTKMIELITSATT